MDASFIGNWLGLIISVATLGGWSWKLVRTVLRKTAEARDTSTEAGKIVEELLSKATNPTRRADIHAYIQFRCTEITTDHTRRKLELYWSAFFLMAVSVIVFAMKHYIGRQLDEAPIVYVWWAEIVLWVGLMITTGTSAFYNYLLTTMEAGWNDKARDALKQRALSHT